MAEKVLDTGGEAFGTRYGGLTKLDYYAIEIAKGRVANNGMPGVSDQEWFVESTYDLAQMFINEKRKREKRKE